MYSTITTVYQLHKLYRNGRTVMCSQNEFTYTERPGESAEATYERFHRDVVIPYREWLSRTHAKFKDRSYGRRWTWLTIPEGERGFEYYKPVAGAA